MFNEVQFIESLNSYFVLIGKWVITSGLRIILITILLLLAIKSAKWISNRAFGYLKSDDIEKSKRTKTLKTIVQVVWKAFSIGLGVMLILGELGINLGPIIATAGVVGLAVGFGAQELVKDIISGFLILLEDQVRVGDIVDLDGKSGLVEMVNIRTIVLRDLEGKVHYIRNGNIQVVTNMTKDYSYYLFDIGISYNDDVDIAVDILKEIDEDLRKDQKFSSDILSALEIFGVDSFGDSAVMIKARIQTLTSRQWHVGREFNGRIKKAFEKNNIEIPFPHRTLYVRTESNQLPHFQFENEVEAQSAN